MIKIFSGFTCSGKSTLISSLSTYGQTRPSHSSTITDPKLVEFINDKFLHRLYDPTVFLDKNPDADDILKEYIKSTALYLLDRSTIDAVAFWRLFLQFNTTYPEGSSIERKLMQRVIDAKDLFLNSDTIYVDISPEFWSKLYVNRSKHPVLFDHNDLSLSDLYRKLFISVVRDMYNLGIDHNVYFYKNIPDEIHIEKLFRSKGWIV